MQQKPDTVVEASFAADEDTGFLSAYPMILQQEAGMTQPAIANAMGGVAEHGKPGAHGIRSWRLVTPEPKTEAAAENVMKSGAKDASKVLSGPYQMKLPDFFQKSIKTSPQGFSTPTVVSMQNIKTL